MLLTDRTLMLSLLLPLVLSPPTPEEIFRSWAVLVINHIGNWLIFKASGFSLSMTRSGQQDTSLNITKTHCDPISLTTCQGGPGHFWPHICCSMNVYVSWCVTDKAITETYVISTGRWCFGGSATSWKDEERRVYVVGVQVKRDVLFLFGKKIWSEEN